MLGLLALLGRGVGCVFLIAFFLTLTFLILLVFCRLVGLIFGGMYTADGVQLASVAQEALIRNKRR